MSGKTWTSSGSGKTAKEQASGWSNANWSSSADDHAGTGWSNSSESEKAVLSAEETGWSNTFANVNETEHTTSFQQEVTTANNRYSRNER